MFCALSTTIERCKTEGVVDVFQMVKALRISKPGAILTVVSENTCTVTSCTVSVSVVSDPLQKQYRLIHDAVLVFLEGFDTYANFQGVAI